MIYYLLLGGNEGDVDSRMSQALTMLSEGDGHITATSSIYQSPAWGYDSALPYHNLAVKLITPVSPFPLLSFTKHVERLLGRSSKSSNGIYHDRPIDIDILLVDNTILNTETLTIPHPRLHLRRFALLPLAQIAPDAIHPLLHKTISQLLNNCPDTSPVTLI